MKSCIHCQRTNDQIKDYLLDSINESMENKEGYTNLSLGEKIKRMNIGSVYTPELASMNVDLVDGIKETIKNMNLLHEKVLYIAEDGSLGFAGLATAKKYVAVRSFICSICQAKVDEMTTIITQKDRNV